MTTQRLILLLLLFFNLQQVAFTQTLKAYEKKAEEAYVEKNYSAALAYNNILLEIEPKRVDALYYGGESARQMRAYQIAESLFEQVPDSSKVGFYALTDFRLANVKKGLKKYNEAKYYYEFYIAAYPDTTQPFTKRAIEELAYCEWALSNLAHAADIEIIHLDSNINTVRTDFAPQKRGDTLYYTSAWYDTTDVHALPITKIFTSLNGNKAVPIIEDIFPQNLHTSHTVFSHDGNRMYFTICQDDENYVNEYFCDIYYRNKITGNKWGKPVKLPPYINMAGYTATQPAIAWDAEKEEELLFYVSDRPGTKGGLDIWYSVIFRDTIFSSPGNVEEVNTPMDDLTPSYHAPSRSLFFSSTGFQSLGGLDIFRVVRMDSTDRTDGYEDDYYWKWSKPENLGFPVNSSYDDLYYTFNSKNAQAHFASNRRPEALCESPEKECTCDDIFEINVEVDLNALTFNSIDSTALTGVEMELWNVTDDILVRTYTNADGHDFHFPLSLEKNYKIIARKEGYESAFAEVDTRGIILSTTFNRTLYLRPKISLIVFTHDFISKQVLNGTIVKKTDESFELDSIILNAPTSNECHFPLEFGRDYTLIGAKSGYSNDYDTFSTRGYTTPKVITRNLYLTPFVGLPLTLYFDNDKPRYVNRRDTTTQLTYGETYEAYQKRKRTFLYGYSRNLSGVAAKNARGAVADFFKNEVETGYDTLQIFSQILVDYLKTGNRLEIIVEGYASPLADSLYNLKLTGRRISSMINHFRTYKDGVLAPYIDSNHLIIKRAPQGESQASKDVSPSERNRQQSVFSPAASRERRVRIIDIRRQEDIFSDLKKMNRRESE